MTSGQSSAMNAKKLSEQWLQGPHLRQPHQVKLHDRTTIHEGNHKTTKSGWDKGTSSCTRRLSIMCLLFLNSTLSLGKYRVSDKAAYRLHQAA